MFSKMAELQRYCKLAGVGIPMAKVLSRQGLYESEGGNAVEAPSGRLATAANNPTPSASAAVGDPSRAGTATPGVPSYGTRVNHRSRSHTSPRAQAEAQARAQAEPRKADGAALEKGKGEMTWKQALTEELWKMMAVLVCALVFSFALKYFKGDSPLASDQGSATSQDGGAQSGQGLTGESNEF